jgi:hypothetical protein
LTDWTDIFATNWHEFARIVNWELGFERARLQVRGAIGHGQFVSGGWDTDLTDGTDIFATNWHEFARIVS